MASSTSPSIGAAAQASQLRERGGAQGWGQQRLVGEIRSRCQVSLLAAYRLARGWTLQDAVTAIADLRGPSEGRRSAVTVQMLNAWERGRVSPSWASTELLCRTYRTSLDRLGLHEWLGQQDHPEENSSGVAVADLSDEALLRSLRGGRGRSAESTLATMAVIRGRMDEHLRRLDTPPSEIIVIESTLEQYLANDAVWPDRLSNFTECFLAAQSLLQVRLTDGQRRDCYRLLARLAQSIAFIMVICRNYDEAMPWHQTACAAGERAGDHSMRAWGNVCLQSRISLYTGHPVRALTEIRQALNSGGGSAAAKLWGWDVEAQLLATLGRSREALGALQRLTTAYDRWKPYLAANVFGYRDQYLYRITALVHAYSGDTHRAADTYLAAQARFPASYTQTTMALDRSVSLVRDGEPEEACRVARNLFDMLPLEHRGGLIQDKLALTLNRMPPKYRDLACVKELRALAATA